MISIFNSFFVLTELISMIRSWFFRYSSRNTSVLIVWFFNIVRCINVIILITYSCILILSCLRFSNLFTIVSDGFEFVNRFKNVVLNSTYIWNVILLNSFVLIIDYFVTVSYNNEMTYLIILSFDVFITFSILLSIYYRNIFVFIVSFENEFEYIVLKMIVSVPY